MPDEPILALGEEAAGCSSAAAVRSARVGAAKLCSSRRGQFGSKVTGVRARNCLQLPSSIPRLDSHEQELSGASACLYPAVGDGGAPTPTPLLCGSSPLAAFSGADVGCAREALRSRHWVSLRRATWRAGCRIILERWEDVLPRSASHGRLPARKTGCSPGRVRVLWYGECSVSAARLFATLVQARPDTEDISGRGTYA